MARFHLALGHRGDVQSLEVHLHRHKYGLVRHNRRTWALARSEHPALSRAPEEIAREYTHYVDIPDEHLHGNAVRWLHVSRPPRPGSRLPEVVLMSQIIPPAHLRAYYGSTLWKERHQRKAGHQGTATVARAASNPHHNGRLHALGIMPDVSEGDQAIDLLVAAQETVDTHSTAVALLAHHPDLGTIQPIIAAHVSNVHIDPGRLVDPDKFNAVRALSDKIGATPDWSQTVECKDATGNPLTADYDWGPFAAGDKLHTYSLAPGVLAATVAPIGAARRTSRDDPALKNQLWRPAPGTSVLKSSDAKAAVTEALALSAATQFKWTVPYQTYTYGIKLDKESLTIDSDGKFHIGCYNIYSRTLYAAYELFDDKGVSLGKRGDLGSISAVDSILGIPVPIEAAPIDLNLGTASSVKLYFGSLGATDWDKASGDELNVSNHGALLTGAWQYAVPLLISMAGDAITDTADYNKIVNDKDLRMAALGILFPIIGGGTAVAAALTNWKVVMTKLAGIAAGFIAKKGMELLGKWVLKKLGEAGLTKALGPVGWVFQLVAMGLETEELAITTGEVLASPALVVAEIKRSIDVSLTLLPDPAHGEAGKPETAIWPSVATRYSVLLECEAGTNFELHGPLTASDCEGSTCLNLTFKDVPAGNKIRLSAGVYSKNGWLAGSWRSDWLPAVPTSGTTLEVGPQAIKENLVPLGIDTQYVFDEKLALSGQTFAWQAGSAPSTTLAALNCSDNGGLCELTALTINNSAFQAGYAWRAAGQHLHPDTEDAPVSDAQLYGVQNVSLLHPEAELKTSKIGFTQKPGIAYAPSSNSPTAIDQANFILDPRLGRMHLRQVVLGDGKSDFGLGDAALLSWGSFPIAELDALAVHPTRTVFACSFSKNKLMILKLPDQPVPDDQAPVALMVSGQGIREGLLRGPKAFAIAPDGRVLLLESVNNRVQAFDVLGNPVSCFTPEPLLFTLKTADVAASLDSGKAPAALADGLVQARQNNVGILADLGLAHQLDTGKIAAQDDPLVAALASLGVTLSYDPSHMADPNQSAQVVVVQAGRSWIVTDPRGRAWEILLESGVLGVYERPAQVKVEVQQAGGQWLLRDDSLGLAWRLVVSAGDPTVVEVLKSLTYFPLQAGPNGANLNYLDMAVEAQGYIYVLSYINDGAAVTDYLLDVYGPDGVFLFRSPDASKGGQQHVVAGRIAVDVWRNLYALTYETLCGPNGATQPGLAHWTPTPPLSSFDLSAMADFNTQNITRVLGDFKAQGIELGANAFVKVIDRDGYWQVQDDAKSYHVYRTAGALQVYSISA